MYFETVILGAGAAGMMCAAQLSGALIIDHAKKAGEKIRISGGGRCNFTNIYADADNFISTNPHFAKSALARYSQWDFLDLVQKHGIAYHEKTLGQLFCDQSAADILQMLHTEIQRAKGEIWLETQIKDICKTSAGFDISVQRDGKDITVQCMNLVVATGGKSIPKMGATGFAYDIAAQFDIPIIAPRPALVPFTFSEGKFSAISGVATPVAAWADGPAFDEALLFTHRGLSGPAMLQISSYWRDGQDIWINLDPQNAIFAQLKQRRKISGRRNLTTELGQFFPTRLVDFLTNDMDLSGNLADCSDARLEQITNALQSWRLRPSGTEGFRTAEVTLGGIDTDALSSKTMQAKTIPTLYFIGECVDVTGWLGGYNFQWAWSSAVAAAQSIRATAHPSN